jgi:hypothetical protein
LPFMISSALGPAGGQLILMDASSMGAASDTVDVLVSRYADIELDNAPSMSVGVTGSPQVPLGAPVTSLYQTDSVGIRCIAYFAASWLRPNGIATMTGISW